MKPMCSTQRNIWSLDTQGIEVSLCHMGVSINGGTPITGWFIREKDHLNRWFRGAPILGNPHMGIYLQFEIGALQTKLQFLFPMGEHQRMSCSPCSWTRKIRFSGHCLHFRRRSHFYRSTGVSAYPNPWNFELRLVNPNWALVLIASAGIVSWSSH